MPSFKRMTPTEYFLTFGVKGESSVGEGTEASSSTVLGENEAVVSAIRHHTTGKADMSLLEMIIYVADYMEPNRDFPGVDKLRELAFSDMDAALKLGLTMTLELLNRQGNEVSPESREALAWLEKKG